MLPRIAPDKPDYGEPDYEPEEWQHPIRRFLKLTQQPQIPMLSATNVLEKLNPLIDGLFNREWTEIDRILEKEGEIKITLAATLNNRDTAPGEHTEKSNLLKVAMSFSERFTAVAECELVTHPELPLSYSGPVHTPDPTVPEFDEDGNGIDSDVNLSSPGAEDAGTTPLGDALDMAASKKEQPLLNIPLDESGWTVAGLRKDVEIKTGKKSSGWDKAARSLLLDLIDACGDDLERVKETIRPHTVSAQQPEPEAVGV